MRVCVLVCVPACAFQHLCGVVLRKASHFEFMFSVFIASLKLLISKAISPFTQCNGSNEGKRGGLYPWVQ